MLKSIAGIVVGYIAMAIFAFAVFTAAYLGLGVDRVFEAETYAVSTLWIAIMLVITLVGGILGGVTCAAISKSRTTGLVFAIVVFLISFAAALPNLMKDHTPMARSGDVPNLQAMTMAQTPSWLCILNPVLAGVGVLMGSRMKKMPTT